MKDLAMAVKQLDKSPTLSAEAANLANEVEAFLQEWEPKIPVRVYGGGYPPEEVEASRRNYETFVALVNESYEQKFQGRIKLVFDQAQRRKITFNPLNLSDQKIMYAGQVFLPNNFVLLRQITVALREIAAAPESKH